MSNFVGMGWSWGYGYHTQGAGVIWNYGPSWGPLYKVPEPRKLGATTFNIPAPPNPEETKEKQDSVRNRKFAQLLQPTVPLPIEQLIEAARLLIEIQREQKGCEIAGEVNVFRLYEITEQITKIAAQHIKKNEIAKLCELGEIPLIADESPEKCGIRFLQKMNLASMLGPAALFFEGAAKTPSHAANAPFVRTLHFAAGNAYAIYSDPQFLAAAIQHYERAVTIPRDEAYAKQNFLPTDYVILAKQGILYGQLKNFAKAVFCFEEAWKKIEKTKEDVDLKNEIHYRLGTSYFDLWNEMRKSQPGEAAKLKEKALPILAIFNQTKKIKRLEKK